MILLDTLLVGGLKFVLRRVADAVDAQMNDEGLLRDELLAAQMRYELGEIDEAELRAVEADVLARLRAARERRRAGEVEVGAEGGTYRVEGIDTGFEATEPGSRGGEPLASSGPSPHAGRAAGRLRRGRGAHPAPARPRRR